MSKLSTLSSTSRKKITILIPKILSCRYKQQQHHYITSHHHQHPFLDTASQMPLPRQPQSQSPPNAYW